MKTIKINEFKVNSKQMQAISKVAEEVKQSFNGWLGETMEDSPESTFGCMVHFNKEQFDALVSILNQI